MLADNEIEFLEWVFKGAVSILFTIGGWMWVMLIKKVNKIENKAEMNAIALSDYKTEVARTYADKNVIERIHDRIDTVQAGVDDIKNILITKFSKP